MGEIVGNLRSEFQNKKVLIVGLGLLGGGVGLAKFFSNLGAKVKVTDKKNEQILRKSIEALKHHRISYRLGSHNLEDFLESDLIIKAPKMRWDDPLILEAGRKGVVVDMETSFFATICPAPIIGITGTRGKSTTTMMIFEMLRKISPKKIYLAGNLPEKLAINLLPVIRQEDLVVLELSSWQLSGFHKKKLSPHIAVFTNFYPDHYDYYKGEEEYLLDKKTIYLHQTSNDFLVAHNNLKGIISTDNPKSKVEYFKSLDLPFDLDYLKGEHNRENAAAALAVGKILKLNIVKIAQTLKSFQGLPYRQETVGKKNGVVFINDTTSTTPVATIKALEAFSKNPLVLLLGGNSKQLPFKSLIHRLSLAQKIVLLKGSFTDELYQYIRESFSEKITERYDDLEKAIVRSYKEAQKIRRTKNKDVFVLFSPGATSFAMFNNEFHRGDEFNRIVKKIIQ